MTEENNTAGQEQGDLEGVETIGPEVNRNRGQSDEGGGHQEDTGLPVDPIQREIEGHEYVFLGGRLGSAGGQRVWGSKASIGRLATVFSASYG